MAWDKKLKKLISNEEFTFSPYFIQADGKVIICDPGNEEHNFEELKDYILMQYTGLKDKNGKEIYEGYLMKFPPGFFEYEGIFIIEWNAEKAWLSAINTKDEEEYGEVYEGPDPPEWITGEVIGNIYENPELLEK